MNIIFRIFCFKLFFLAGINLFSNNIKRGVSFNVTPSFVFQEQDSLLKSKYDSVQALYKRKEYSKALDESLKLIPEIKDKGDSNLEFNTLFLIGDIFRKINNHDKALEFFKQSKKILLSDKSLNVESNKEDSFYLKNLSRVFLRLGVGYSRVNQKDSAKYYYNKIIEIESLNKDVLSLKASAFNNLSTLFIRDSMFDLAREYTLKAVEVHKKNNNRLSEAATLGNLASIYLIEKDYKKAKEVYFKGLDLIKKDNSSNAVKFKEDLYYNLAYTLYLLKDYKAYDYQEKSYDIKDDLRDKEIRRIVEEIYARQKVDLEEQKVNLVKSQVELKKLQDRKTALFFSILSLLVVIISGVILYNYKLRQRNLKLKLDQNELIQQKKH